VLVRSRANLGRICIRTQRIKGCVWRRAVKPTGLPSQLSSMSTRIKRMNFLSMKSSSLDSSLLCDPPHCITRSFISTKPSGSESQKTTDFPSYPMKSSVTCQPVTSLETVSLPCGIPDEPIHPLADLSPYANVTMQADAPATPANIATFAPHATASTLGGSAKRAKSPK
jgi:hypothetical protein